MAEPTGPRCTRRKQANPRRKNVELEDMPEEVDLDHLGPNDAVTKDAVAADSDAEQTLCPDSANGASRDGFQTPEGASGCAMAERPSQHHPPPPPSVSPTTPNHHHHHQNHHHSPKSHVPRSPPALPNGCPGNKAADEDFKSEEEKIQEYLQRSDTAVIYPEPVDGETDAHNGHASPSPAPLVDEVPSNGKATDKDFYLKCPHCAKASSSIDALRSHLVTQHGASDPLPLPPDSGHPCDKCSATFALKEQLEKHEQLHSPSGQVVNLDFIDGKGTWNAAHVTACKVCSKTFANVYRLQRHMISHDESAVLRKFKCPECEKAFKFKHHLKEHIRIHSGEKPFVCPNCGKRFSHSGSYSSHMTSKKCLVMNLKVPRRTVDKPVRPTAMGGGAGGGGTNGRRTNPQGGAFTPILPKYGENGLELSSPGYVSGSGSSTGGSGSVLSPENFGLDFSHPFLSPYAPLPQYPLMAVATAANQIYNSGFHPYPNMPPLGSSGHVIRPSTLSAKHADEAKQPPTPPTPPKAEPPSSPPGAFTSSAYGDMNVVHKILAAVNATVSKQQQQGVGKPKNGFVSRDTSSPSLPPLTRSEAHSPTTPSPPAASPQPPSNIDVKRNGLKSDDSHCRYCGHFFESKIDLHQHERYLCKLNGDIFPRPPPVIAPAENASEHAPSADQRPPPPGWTKDAEASTSPRASSTGDGQEPSVNGYSEPDDDFQSDECADGNRDNQTDERKVRMRSLIADEHLAVLRAHYDSNPRPSKEEVQRLAMQLKFSTRVVQVWFQNMRARDKKRGRTFQESSYSTSANIDKAEGASNTVPTSIAVTPPPPTHSSLPVRPFSAITPTPFGPVMPHFNGVLTTPRLPLPLFYPPPTTPNPFPLRHNGHCSPTTTTSYATAVSLAPPFPMDGEQPLDLSLKSKERPMSSSSSCHSPASDQDGEVLNLSHKSSRTSTPCKESNNHVTSYGFTPSYSSHSNSTVIFSSPINTFSTSHPLHQYHPLENSALFKYIQREGLLPSSHSLPTPPGLVKIEDPESAHMDDVVSLASTNDLRVHDRKRIVSPISLETPRLHQILASGTTSSPPPHLQESPSLNGTVDSTGHVYSTDGSHSPCGSDHEDQLEIDEAGDGKRIWKQAEGEDSQLDLDDSSLGEDDRPIKRRKSWKQHKLDSEEGLYACDQCDKVFSKQSSLARHKYEHSGQRPHKCDVCGKAFKHKHHLTEHKRLHSGEKPFQCKKCLKRFSHSGSYSQHMNHRYSYCKPYRE